MVITNSRRQTLFALIFLVAYGAFRFIWTEILDSIHNYASYVFEVVFVVVTLKLLPNPEKEKSVPGRKLVRDFAISSIAGFIVFKLANVFSLPIPFDLSSTMNLLLLLLIGPILEELLFRGALWRLFRTMISKASAIMVITSVLFSLAHFTAWFRVPIDLQPFILFQTGYTLLLGLYCGLRRSQTLGISAPVFCHLGFNLGFYLGTH
jgi:membrane protease YdiL (CAAX protease family)